MPKKGKITPQQIRLAQKIISLLPKKDNSYTREEAGELLADYLRLAFKKGYSPQEICAIFREVGIVLTVKVVAKYQTTDAGGDIDANKLKGICGKYASKKRPTSTQYEDASGENELPDREEIADASVDVDAQGLEETAPHSTADASASGESCDVPTENAGLQSEKASSAPAQKLTEQRENAEPVSEKDATGGIKSGVAKQNNWSDLDMDDWCGPAKSASASAQGW